jgi:hypothetical protein
MPMESEPIDIRDRAFLQHADVAGLNFIRADGSYVFRRHHRSGLRSHILELLRPADVARESTGVVVGGLRRFPRARPLKMLRIFRRRFTDRRQALEEIRRLRMLESFLTAGNLASSCEFIVEYHRQDRSETLLCGLQEYVRGVAIDPWSAWDPSVPEYFLRDLLQSACLAANRPRPPLAGVRRDASRFIGRVRAMIDTAGCIPDLAGVRNLLLTASGRVRLVDINNISDVHLDDRIRLDDKGYPVGDKSIEALALLEQKLLGREIDRRDPLYAHFLQPDRMVRVRELDAQFHRSL